MLLDALAMANARGIIFRGWGDLGNGLLPETVLAIDSVPHDWLFPRCTTVVTHGGAGTVAAAVCAGRPCVVVPFFGDQRFWAGRVQTLGLGPAPIPRAELTAPTLAAAIRATIDHQDYRARAELIGRQLHAEHGAHHAADALELVMRKTKDERRKTKDGRRKTEDE